MTMQSTADAVIIGGGVMGCSILCNLAVRGVRDTVLLERDVLGSGSTGKSQAICRMHYSNRITAEMAWKSLAVYQDFGEAVGGHAGFVKTGYLLVVGPEDREALEDNVSMQRDLGINTSLISPEDVEEIAPMINVRDVAGLAYEPESGYADPYLVTASYATRSRDLGAKVLAGTPAIDIEIAGGRVRSVTTGRGTIETPVAVVATGPWARDTFSKLGVDIPLETTRHQVIAIRRPEDIIPTHPIVGDIAQEISFRPEHTDLTLIGVGDAAADPETYDQGVDMAIAADAFTKLVRRMPGMSQGYFRGGWSGLFTVSPDWHPIIDRVEGIEGLYCAAGFSGHGFKLAPMVGIAMSELILEGQARTVDISPLAMDRFREGRALRSRYRYGVLA